MGFFSGKNSSASASNAQQIENEAQKAEYESTIANLEIQAKRFKEEVNSTKEQNRILQSNLNDRDRQINEHKADMQRLVLANKANGQSDCQKDEMYQTEIKNRDERINQLKFEIESIIQLKNKEIDALSQKMLSVMDEKDHQIKRLNALGAGAKKGDNVRIAISAEAKKFDGNLPKFVKSPKESALIMDSLRSNTFMKCLQKDQIQKIIDAMQKKSYVANTEIIREGDNGDNMYVLDEGTVSVLKGADKEFITDLSSGMLFGELAILHNCRRTATILSKTKVSVWYLERHIFQAVVRSAGEQRDEERLQMLLKVKDLKTYPEDKLRKIVDCLEEEQYEDGQCIIRQGTVGDHFFIIKSGKASVRKDLPNGDEDEVALLEPGNYFGERALIKEEKRNANIYAKGVTICYTLDRTAFVNLVGKVSDNETDNKTVDIDDTQSEKPRKKNEKLTNCSFNDIKIIQPLGAGGFGLVKLCRVASIPEKTFALKCIQKCRVVQYGQQRHIMDERNILFEMDSVFILRLYKTFKDNKFVYLLSDAYLGGDLWSVIYGSNRTPFNDAVARFYVGCVVEAFGYLHKRHYCYRDLKPENLMLNERGYVIVVDLGFAKKVPPGHKTWTFCGTPEYIPPEIISNKGHNIAADYWSLGILIFELLARRTPFRAKDDMAIYEGILRGIHSVQFPPKMSRKAESMVKSLCRQEPSERIGYQKAGVNDIRKHRWFQGFDWDGLRAETLQAPMTPVIKGCDDVSNFEEISDEDEQSVPEEKSGWDAAF